MSDRTKALQDMSAIPHLAEDILNPLEDQNASRPYQELVAVILSGAAPDVEDLRGLGTDLERSYGMRPQRANGGFQYQRQINILEHAVRSGNLQAVRAVLEAGHDPNLAGFEFARASAPNPTGPPDWSTSPPFLEAYLEFGGNPDYPTADSPFPMISRAGSAGNFEGVKLLLSRGADPWIEVRGSGWPDNPAPASSRVRAVPDMIKGDAKQLEFFVWLHEEGFMSGASEEMQALIYDRFLDNAAWYTGPSNHLGEPRTGLIRDAFAISLGQDITYRRDEREAFVAALDDYLAQKANRP